MYERERERERKIGKWGRVGERKGRRYGEQERED
jgi:hypothetical protein